MANKKRLIDANALKEYATGGVTSVGILTIAEIDNAPTVDAVEVVRCKDCKHFVKLTKDSNAVMCVYSKGMCFAHENDFCSHGERKDNGV